MRCRSRATGYQTQLRNEYEDSIIPKKLGFQTFLIAAPSDLKKISGF